MTVSQARQILAQFGYKVLGYQAMGKERHYCVWRGQLAEFCNLPIGGSFNKDGLKAFVGQVTATVQS